MNRFGIEITEHRKTFTAMSLVLVMFASLVACTAVDQILSDLEIATNAAGVIGAAVEIVAPGDGLLVQGLANTATAGLAAIKTAYDTYEASGAVGDRAKLIAAIQAVQTNLPAELAAAHITNPATVAVVTAWVNMTLRIVTSIMSAIGNVTATTSNAIIGKRLAVAINKGAIPSKSSLRYQWSHDVCGGNSSCSGLLK
jgi:hypothetical protein